MFTGTESRPAAARADQVSRRNVAATASSSDRLVRPAQ
ncbi:Uncharacterised protein [Mycobacterium tuberculosis]|uniref:Uncharacterized protein n=1 Tax=Mycobacterium tuberculosis TaxID=1773 RepID=A0A655AQF7_MYCTX|nr:Uncharacterised protein [Mycobacterium tuberculosis]CKQ79182.1 Uncharacterised protein [Mycobacterium tuberculosis]CKR71510.1 Uncharacterised protein [Mycobacterium tuberculosis]CKT73905.1 Uncharacterised protein [Mycobacterium tuberculosis]CKU31754.1 Uncharacterised protein [Mycobacterium tuberculosis]